MESTSDDNKKQKHEGSKSIAFDPVCDGDKSNQYLRITDGWDDEDLRRRVNRGVYV